MMMSETKVLELQNVAYFYRKKKGFFFKEPYWALKDVSFSLRKGESLGIIGRNGAGKSTLLRLLAGIAAPDKGSFVNLGYTVSLISLQAGFVPYLTGRENAYINGMLLGLRKSAIRDKMESISEYANLGDFFDQPINTYSSGMKARLGFSIALQLDPDVLLIDELLGVGDVEFRRKSSASMKEKILSDKTVVLVSHQAATIKELCRRAVWIENGVSIAEGPSDEVMDQYEASTNGNMKK